MKSLIKLLTIIACLGYFSLGFANLQPSKPQLIHSSEKTYVELSDLLFSHEGIFLKNAPDNYIQVQQIQHDSIGYFLRGIVSNYVAYCNNCRHPHVNRMPPKCDYCTLSKGYDVQYSDYWDRRQ